MHLIYISIVFFMARAFLWCILRIAFWKYNKNTYWANLNRYCVVSQPWSQIWLFLHFLDWTKYLTHYFLFHFTSFHVTYWLWQHLVMLCLHDGLLLEDDPIVIFIHSTKITHNQHALIVVVGRRRWRPVSWAGNVTVDQLVSWAMALRGNRRCNWAICRIAGTLITIRCVLCYRLIWLNGCATKKHLL